VSHRPLRAYIDETGDRGNSGLSSPFFAFAAVLVTDEDEPGLRATMGQLRNDLTVPAGKALHWKEHVKTYPRRQHVARSLAQVPGLMIVYVVVEKAAIPTTYDIRNNQVLFYNFAACMTMERILRAARDWHSGTRDVVVRFGHVRGFDHTTTTAFFEKKAVVQHGIPWERLHGNVHFDDQNQWDGLQAADQYAGILNAAIRADQFGGYEESHLMRVRHQIRKDLNGRSWSWGFKVKGNAGTFTSLPWWPPEGL
jgi:hypothetical protein